MPPNPARFSKYILLCCMALMAYSSFCFYPRWNKAATESNIAWDVEGYYWYLPSLFIFRDIKHQQFKDSILNKYQASATGVFQHGFIHEGSGNYVLKYTSGMAILYLPAFTAGHIAAHFLDYPQDGFSPPYKLALQIWALLFSLMGLAGLRRLLLYYYPDHITAIVLLLLVAGTNYLNYAAIDTGMSHSWLFTIYVWLLLATRRFYQSFRFRDAALIGLLCGLATLVRPTEVIALLLPLLWGLDSFRSLPARLQLLLRSYRAMLLSAGCFAAVVFIQPLYWKYASGEWFVYSYQDQGFSFHHPHAFVYAFSNRAGWLRYCPMMLLAFIGLLPFLLKGRNKLAVIGFFVLNYYLVSAWNIWDYGGFSGRAMIQSYPILLFPVASLLVWAGKYKWLLLPLVPFILLSIYLNLWWTWQAHKGTLLDPICSNKAFYWRTVGRWTVPEYYFKLKDTDELLDEAPAGMQLVYAQADTSAACVDKLIQGTPPVSLPAAALHGNWVRAAASFECDIKEWNVWQMPQLIVTFVRADSVIKLNYLRLHRFVDNHQTRDLFLDVALPPTPFDSVKVQLWNAGSDKRTCMRRLQLWSFRH